MIFDRTQNDVDTAIRLRNEKVKFDPITMQPINPEELTESEIASLEKGTITYNTLNRIENKQDELKNLFNDMGYWNTPITNKVWGENDIFNVDEFQRIIDNTNILRQAFFVYKSTPNTPPVSYHYNDINALEKILYNLDVMINDVKSRYRRCGTFSCGELTE
jgi:hypothetical protein